MNAIQLFDLTLHVVSVPVSTKYMCWISAEQVYLIDYFCFFKNSLQKIGLLSVVLLFIFDNELLIKSIAMWT